jgi:diguanylate cyclase (GGDEF)-like protein
MSLRVKFGIASALVALLAISLALFGVHALGSTSDLIVRLYDRPLMGVNYARAANNRFTEARGLARRIPSLDPTALLPALTLLRTLENGITEDLRIVRERVTNPGVANALDHAEASIAAWFRMEQAILAPGPEGLIALPTQVSVDRQDAAAVSWLDDLVELVAADGFAYRARAEGEMRAFNLTIATLAGGMIALIALSGVLFARFVIRPIGAATLVAERVAVGQTAPIEIGTRGDEIGRLMSCLAVMQANLLGREKRTQALLEEKVQVAETLRHINVRFDTALNNMSHGLLMCDAAERVVVINRRFCDLYRIDPASIPSDACYRDLIALSVASAGGSLAGSDNMILGRVPPLQAGQRATGSKTLPDGRTIAVSYEPMAGGGWIATHDDISERLKSEEQIVFLARHDALTGLPNRVTFHERLNQAMARAERGGKFALLNLDLDQFKSVNDALGHLAGDNLLKAVAGRLQCEIREGDTVARLGGDEFAILQLDVETASEASRLANRIVEVVSQPYDVEGQKVVIGVSIGIVLAPADSANPMELVKRADLALYRAKQDGRDTWRFFDPTMDTAAKARRELGLDLHDAMALGQLELHFQPLVSARHRVVTGFETLLRWRHPLRGMVSPGEFISIAEETGLIAPIGAWVLHQACAEAAKWPNHIRVAVNLSPLQFRSQSLLDTVCDALRCSGIAAQRLELEITESVPLQDDHRTLSTLHALQDLGCRVALDDFGTGYSSLSYLRSFPFNTIKIDRSFVSELGEREECAAIVQAIAALGHSLKVHITAEGVETEDQFKFLAAAGCTEIQGYLFSKPVPAGALGSLIELLSVPHAPATAAIADMTG